MKTLFLIPLLCLLASTSSRADQPAVNWESRIDDVVGITDSVQANIAITRAHYDLSQSLRKVIGRDGGANFHTWAVWGSYKAGESIRGEDVPYANAIVQTGRQSRLCDHGFWSDFFPQCAVSDVVVAELHQTAVQISHGNRLVLSDIGKVSGRFIHFFAQADTPDRLELERFLSTVQDAQLRRAFTQYWRAKYTSDLKQKQEFMLLGNLYAILHEHNLLQPIIKRAIPHLTHLFTTAFLLNFRVGDEILSVSNDLPAYAPNGGTYPWSLRSLENAELGRFLSSWDHSRETYGSGAADWTKLKDRMNYICSLFRTRHLDPELFLLP